MRMIGLLLLLCAAGSYAQTDVTGYETVTVTIPAESYNADAGGTGKGAPQMAPVKYNRQCALVITSDDMGTGEYLNNWALMNGYPLYGDWRLGNDGKVNWGICPRGEDALSAPYSTTYMGARSQDVNDYKPLTFTDDAGKEHRFTATSAIWPNSYNDNNYAHMQGNEAQIMVRTGWSFAQHDVNNITGATKEDTIASIASRFQPLSELWANNVTGIGLKIMVEPNGDKKYVDATAASNEMCWSIFQSADATHTAISSSVSTWTTSLPTSFSNKNNGSTTRTFPNADATKEQNFLTQTKTAIANGSTDAIFYGCHGMGAYPRQLVTDIATNATYKDKVWVTSADEFWEYYNIYNNAIIGTPSWDNDNKQLSFTVQVPKYKKNQFRELTINIPGITSGTGCTLTSSDGTVTTGSYVQTADASKGYVVNFGMETKILDYIDQLTTLYRKEPSNLFIKRDAQYLIDQLLPGATKTAKQNALDKNYDYSYLAVANLQENNSTVSTKTLSSGYYDEATDVTYYIPRYILEGTTLYKTSGNGNKTLSGNTITQPWYGNYLSVSTANINVPYTYAKEKENVVFYTEAENISPVNSQSGVIPDHTTNWNSYQGRVEALCSGGSGAKRDNNNYGTITTLEPGTYKVTIGVVASSSNDGGYYSIRVGGTEEANEVGRYAGATADQLTEFTTEEFTVKSSKTVTIYHSGSGLALLDYLFIQKTADFVPSDPTVTLTTNVSAAQVNSTVTLKATPVWNGKGALTSLKFQYKTTGGADSEFTDIATIDNPVSDTEYTQIYTPTSLGTYVFRAILTDADAAVIKTTDDAATAASAGAVAISVQESVPYEGDYTLHLIDNSGNEVFTQTVTHATVAAGNHDPLADQYRSPFVSQYLYFDSQAEATANSGTPSFWNQQDVYVGYTVDATKMSATKTHTITSRDRYMHMVWRLSQKDPTSQMWLQHQDYDVSDIPSGASSYIVRNEGVTTESYALMDNSFIWQLGDDPYNVTFKNKATGYYANPTGNSSAGVGTTSTSSYAILYWTSKNGTTDTEEAYCRVYYRGSNASTPIYVMSRISNGYDWVADGTNNGNYEAGSKIYFQNSPTPLTINVVNPYDPNGEVECQLEAYYNSTANMQAYIPYSLRRAYTTGHALHYNKSATEHVTMGSAPLDGEKLAANGYNLYLTYSIEDSKWRTAVTTAVPTGNTTTINVHSYKTGDDNIYWYILRANNDDSKCIKANTDALPSDIYNASKNDINAAVNNSSNNLNYRSHWAFIGTPYHLQLADSLHGLNRFMGYGSNPQKNDRPQVYEQGVIENTVWEVAHYLYNRDNLFFRPQGSLNGQRPRLYLSQDGKLSENCDDGSKFDFYLAETSEAPHISRVNLVTETESPYYLDHPITLKATATPSPSGSDKVSSLVIQQEVNGEWTSVTTAEAAIKDETTKAVTTTYTFTPNAVGTYNFRAYAVIDNADQYSSDIASAGGDGSVLAINATVEPVNPKNSEYTLILIDKSGNELLTETNVPASRITEVNSVSSKNQDPLKNDYRSPLVTTYKYYEGTTEGKTSAQAANDHNLVNWNTYDGTTVYVGYTISDEYDLDGSENRESDGKKYLLKFADGESFKQEQSDGFETDAKPGIYPYVNGEGGLFVYGQHKLDAQGNDAASTRTRWLWYLEGGDPYRIRISSLQTRTDGSQSETSYSYLRTYKPVGYNSVVTGVISNNSKVCDGNDGSDPSGSHDVRHKPTEYMILNGTNGHLKLVTTELVDGAHQPVNSFENYWKSKPTAANLIHDKYSDFVVGTSTPTPAQTQAALVTDQGWHSYNVWANGSSWTSGKTFGYQEHWFKTIGVGTNIGGTYNGDFDLVETELDGVIVLLDNHGWEIMRKPISKTDDPRKADRDAEIAAYNSPMVETYHFWINYEKVPSYHKYWPIQGKGTDKDAEEKGSGTSLTDYPRVAATGTLADIYVTYDVKDEYANSYVGAATVAGTSASKFFIRQGSTYATTADGTSITTTSDVSTITDNLLWYMKPNFDIDDEMNCEYGNETFAIHKMSNKWEKTNETYSKTALYEKYLADGKAGFDPYNLQIISAAYPTKLFTTKATDATRNGSGGLVSTYSNTKTVSLETYGMAFTMSDYYDVNTYPVPEVTNSTFMAVKDQYGNMRLMPRFDHSHVVDNFATLADPATLDAYTPTNSQTTQVATPVTYHIIDNSGNDALQMTVTDGIGLSVPDALKSPMVSAYQFHSTLAHASDAATRATGNLTVAQPDVYVSYTVDATKMAANKKYAISSGTSNVFLHFVFRGNEATSSHNNFEYRYRTDQQKYDQEDVGSPTPAVNQFDHSNLPFVDKTYLWTLGDDPYNITITSEAARNWKYLARNPNSSPEGQVIQKKDVGDASKYCLLYWNGDPTSEYSVLRYAGLNAETYVQYDGNNNGKWVDATTNSENNAKLLIEELPEINVNVVNADGEVEYTLAGRYLNNASVPASNKVPFFLQRSYTSGQTYYYTLANAAAKENAITAGTVPVAATMTENMTDGKYNLYVRYDLDAAWNTENLFVVSTNESKTYYIVKYPANSSTPYLAVNSEKKVIGLSNSISDEAHWAIYGTPYALRLESRANSRYYVGIPENDWSATPQLYNSFDNIISTWELAAYTNSKDDATYKPMPLLRPQGAISRETPLVYLRPNGNSVALADKDDNKVRLTFEGAAKVTLTIVDKSGREVISEQVSAATIESTSGDPLSAGLRSPYAKNYKYYATLAEAQANSGETALNTEALLGKTEQTVYVGYDAITSENVAEGETILKMNGTAAYRIRRNANNTQAMHAVFAPNQTNSSDNNYGWKMDNQTKDYYNGETVNYNTLPFIDRAWAWEFVSENGDPYNVKIRNKATGQYLGCENNSNKQYQTKFASNDANATVYSLLTYGKNDQGNATKYLAIYVSDATTSQTGYLTYNTNEGGSWRLRGTRNDPSNSDNDALAYIKVEELNTLLDIHIVGPAGTSHAGEVEATIHGYRNSGVGANIVPNFVPYFLSRAYTSDQKFYYTKEAAVAATENTEISSVTDESITDSHGSDGVKDVFVSYTLDTNNWIPSGTALSNEAKTANTTIVKPFYSGEGKINWYGIRASAYNNDFLKAGADIPAAVTRTTLDTSNADDVEMKKSEWAFIGTPYSLQLVERYHGMSSHLGVADDAVLDDRAYVYANGAEGSVTTFELLTGLGNVSSKLFLRPQGSLNAQTPYLYLGGNDDNMPLSKQASSTQGLDLTWIKETDAKTLTFTLYDPQGNSMSNDISDYTFTGVSAGDNLAELFAVTGMKRRYCDYTYYSDNTLTTIVTTASSDANETVYVKWEYTDDAPVFSTGDEPRDYQYYMMNAHNGSSPYGMKVTGNSTDGYTLKADNELTPVKEGYPHFAMVGTPYGFKLYSRYAGMNLKTNSTGSSLVFSGESLTEAVFDLPIPVNSSITQSTKMDLRMKDHPDKHIWCSADNIWMNTSTGGYLQLTYIIVPVRVFKEGSTAIGNIVDHQEYALTLNPNGTALATTARITENDLHRSSYTGDVNYQTNDFRHAFCNYTFYHTYDWTTGALSNAIPSTGSFAGLPYYGGKNDQFARSFFATYSVDDEQFSKIYVLDNANAQTLKFFGCGTKTTTNEKDYFPIVSEKATLADARADDTNAYRWYMTGDPYNLQLTCLGTGDDYQNIPLGVQKVHTSLAETATIENGMLARLTNDATYAVKSHWEVVQNTDGNHIFFLVDDVTTYDDADRYTYSLGQRVYTSPDLYASSNQIYALHLTPAVPQFSVVWKVMERSSGSYTEVASYTKANVSQGVTLTLADMPEVLRRHFCEYNNMYSEQTCTTQYTGNEATVGDADLNIYVPYTLKAGAPMFYASVADYNAATGDDSDPVLIRLNHAKYAYTAAATDESATTTDSKDTASSSKWVLIGSPYNVKLYNIVTQKYLYVNWSNISPNAVIPMAASPDATTTNDTWTILDDASGDYAVLCLKEDDNHQMLFVGYDTSGNVVMNIPNSKSEAMTAEFIGSFGIEGATLVLHYGENTLRKDANGNSMAGQIENFTVSGFFNQDTPLADVMPSVMKRPFCNYTFKYKDTEYTAVEKNPMCTDSQPVTIDVYYERDESLFKWSTATADNADKYWYYLVNNHVPAGSGEQGKMYYRDSSPKLRVSQSLVQTKLYLNNFEWCVIGDPYGFKMLNRYDPDHKFSEYIRVMDYNDNHNDGLQLEQNDGNDNQNIFEMMPGTYSYNFWMHPVYSSTQLAEYAADSYSFVSQNYNGSAAIIPTGKKTMAYLKANSSANLRLERRSDATLKDYLNYAGFVGALKYDVANGTAVEVNGKTVDIAAIKTKMVNGTATDEEKALIHDLINNPDNTVNMAQGYYRLIPYTWENNKSERRYVRGYLDDRERTGSSGYNKNLKVETQALAEYDPASIFWFESTTHDGTENGYPRYYVNTQGLNLTGNGLSTEDGFKCSYEGMGAAIMQLKSSSTSSHEYLSCAAGDETSTNQCFDEQAGLFKTRFYLQPVGDATKNLMPLKVTMNKGHNGTPLLTGDEYFGDLPTRYSQLPYTYATIYVPYDLKVEGVDVVPFIGLTEHSKGALEEQDASYFFPGEKSLFCQSIDEHQKVDSWKGNNSYIPAATPVLLRSVSGMENITFTIPTDAPSTSTSANVISENVLGGSYLRDENNSNETVCLFGREAVSVEVSNSYPSYAYTGRVGFFPRYFKNGVTQVAIPANKAYYGTLSVGSSRAIFFEFDDDSQTGIVRAGSGSREGNGATYDLQGRRVEHVNRPGIYIRNGRKIMVK